jgi:hypothetical protein
LARCGLKLETLSQSSQITSFYPDFTIHPGEDGKTALKRLLSFVPDVLRMEGLKACLVNPLAEDAAEYEYRSGQIRGSAPFHPILESRYRSGKWKVNRLKAEGAGVTADSFAWDEIRKFGDIPEVVEDLNIDTASRAHERGNAFLRRTEIESTCGRTGSRQAQDTRHYYYFFASQRNI